MIDLIKETTAILSTIPGLNYVDENTGQLDSYSPNFPVKWPCSLIDVSNADFTDIGSNKTANPINRQMGTVDLEIRVANLKLTNTSGAAPANQVQPAQSIHEIIQLIHEKIHGTRIISASGKAMRKKLQRVKRDDGVQEYIIIYSVGLQDA